MLYEHESWTLLRQRGINHESRDIRPVVFLSEALEPATGIRPTCQGADAVDITASIRRATELAPLPNRSKLPSILQLNTLDEAAKSAISAAPLRSAQGWP